MERSAGILLHISSLPGESPIGDFGSEAYRFVDFLKEAGQSYWQILPLNQTDGGKAYSPYSPLSVFAGNTLFIDGKAIKNIGKTQKPKSYAGKKSTRVHFQEAERYKETILTAAYKAFKKHATEKDLKKFDDFCVSEHFWLHDYSLFIVLKNSFGRKAWIEWPEEYRDRHQESLDIVLQDKYEEIRKEKYAQYLFFKQWQKLKAYANKQGIQIFGDVPIYTSYDSADVWAHPHYFLLRENKKMDKVAGVPPDYFNEDGQLWNMPIYNWDALKQNGYEWWIERLKKNLQLFDLVRLDHFRGFSSFWEINAEEETAINGEWKQGPGKDFFNAVQQHFPSMPFAAEDLGEIDQAVYDLRDRYNLPGMSVVQFGFGDDFPNSIHLPHNFTRNSIVYSGTHDNNTARGWYSDDLKRKQRKRLKAYISGHVYRSNLHKKLIRLVYQSVGKIAIIPMQDILGFGTEARMNYPSTIKGNWMWRMKKSGLKKKLAVRLEKIASPYGRTMDSDTQKD